LLFSGGQTFFLKAGNPCTLIQSYSTPGSRLNTVIIAGGIVILSLIRMLKKIILKSDCKINQIKKVWTFQGGLKGLFLRGR